MPLDLLVAHDVVVGIGSLDRPNRSSRSENINDAVVVHRGTSARTGATFAASCSARRTRKVIGSAFSAHRHPFGLPM